MEPQTQTPVKVPPLSHSVRGGNRLAHTEPLFPDGASPGRMPTSSSGGAPGPVTDPEGATYVDDVIIGYSVSNDENKKVSNRASHGASAF